MKNAIEPAGKNVFLLGDGSRKIFNSSPVSCNDLVFESMSVFSDLLSKISMQKVVGHDLNKKGI